MNFDQHYDLVGKHSFLSASQYHWVNYSDEKLVQRIMTSLAAKRGTELHALASDLIRLNVKLPRTKATLNEYVNDAIGFKMQTEQVLYYSPNCFGTADAICFKENKNTLRIHDLKTGVIPASMLQLRVYSAMFCLEYDMKPAQINTELRIYQNDEVLIEIPDPDEVTHIMDRIVSSDKLIERQKMEVL